MGCAYKWGEGVYPWIQSGGVSKREGEGVGVAPKFSPLQSPKKAVGGEERGGSLRFLSMGRSERGGGGSSGCKFNYLTIVTAYLIVLCCQVL